jgi:hypothetical protein
MSILDPALRNALRTLKLTGMLNTLDARLAQTRDGTPGATWTSCRCSAKTRSPKANQQH